MRRARFEAQIKGEKISGRWFSAMGMGTSSVARLSAIFFAIILVTSAFQVAEAGTSKRSRGSNAPVRTASAKHGLDPSNFVVVVIAALILVYGAKVWSRSSPQPGTYLPLPNMGNPIAVRPCSPAWCFRRLTCLSFPPPEGSPASVRGHVHDIQPGGIR